MSNGDTPEQKAIKVRARQILTDRLGNVPVGCHKCKLLSRCARLAPANPVLCELSDAEIGLTLPIPADWRREIEDEDYYYWQARIKMPGRAGGCE